MICAACDDAITTPVAAPARAGRAGMAVVRRRRG